MHCFNKSLMAIALTSLLSGTATADEAETKGGLKITSDDGNFSASLGGRIHFDTYLFDTDIEDPISTTDFRRARITLKGNIYDWGYVLEQDFTGGDTLSGYRDVFISHKFLNGEVRIGQFKPFRSMAEMTSSNELTMLERPFSSATGLYDGNQFQQGIGWTGVMDCFTLGMMAFNLRDAGTPRNEGVGAAGRLAWAPINTDEKTLHFGTYVSFENANRNSPDLIAEADYAGRRGPSQLMALTPGNLGGDATTAGLELAGSYGPLYLQAEYVIGGFEGDFFISEEDYADDFGAPAPFPCDPEFGCYIDNQTVHTWYVQGSWMLTGEHKAYSKKRGAFSSAKPSGDGLWGGAWELTFRYDTMENRDYDFLEASSTTVGLNFYANRNVRFMFNYIMGDDDFTGDNTDQFGIRAQIGW
ncbi:OprO/OprP family phosphate-selective porin [Microbulbifer sp. CAU 1566]|uniref:OprO/OprP family phosphate-selective porin n=1 Tax=Microbulbifer sp. CAU 1566 TaxID=2933269 RepID=UPI0020034686|nr:porin [Microbulbifer sp. CAU 1566]MCK7597118.1 OprO/OprP family phosphate-selective porin [Microbulbifer sp. CAU 1566]